MITKNPPCNNKARRGKKYLCGILMCFCNFMGHEVKKASIWQWFMLLPSPRLVWSLGALPLRGLWSTATTQISFQRNITVLKTLNRYKTEFSCQFFVFCTQNYVSYNPSYKRNNWPLLICLYLATHLPHLGKKKCVLCTVGDIYKEDNSLCLCSDRALHEQLEGRFISLVFAVRLPQLQTWRAIYIMPISLQCQVLIRTHISYY